MSVQTIDQQALKSSIIRLVEEDSEFRYKIASLFQVEEQPMKSPLEMNDEEHAEFMRHVKEKYAIKWEDLEPLKVLFEDEERSAEELVKML